MPRSLRKICRHPLVQFSFFVLLIVASRSAIADWNYVPSGSMKPTLLEGDLIFVNRLAYDLKVPFTTWHIAEWSEPQRGDIVVAYSPENDTRIVKRVVAVPGDRVALQGQTLLVNGQHPQLTPAPTTMVTPLSWWDRKSHRFTLETVLGHSRTVMVGPMMSHPPLLPQNYIVPPEHFFVMGDHRNNSRDSRFYGAIPRDQILGQATHVIGSVDILDSWQPRWGRFFSAM